MMRKVKLGVAHSHSDTSLDDKEIEVAVIKCCLNGLTADDIEKTSKNLGMVQDDWNKILLK